MIKLNNILGISKDEVGRYNVHLACWNGDNQPLDVFLRSTDEYQKWQEWKGNKSDDGDGVRKQKFTREYILSFATIYNESNDLHLFTGLYKITDRSGDAYKVELRDEFSEYTGRLVIKHKRSRNVSRLLEGILDNTEIHTILPKRMECKVFPGPENINAKFLDIQLAVRSGNIEWKGILENLKGVYLLIDDSNNKKYVGSAYGEYGIWNRWSNYINNYTGNNKGLDELHKVVGEEHFKQNFRFVLLEYFTNKTPNEFVIQRENFWKEALNSYHPTGYNRKREDS